MKNKWLVILMMSLPMVAFAQGVQQSPPQQLSPTSLKQLQQVIQENNSSAANGALTAGKLVAIVQQYVSEANDQIAALEKKLTDKEKYIADLSTGYNKQLADKDKRIKDQDFLINELRSSISHGPNMLHQSMPASPQNNALKHP